MASEHLKCVWCARGSKFFSSYLNSHMWPVATTLDSADGEHLATWGFAVATVTGGTATIYGTGEDTTLPATRGQHAQRSPALLWGDPLEPLPRIQPHQLISGQREAQRGLVRCGQKPGLRPSQSSWGREAAAAGFWPEEEGSFPGEPLVPAGSGVKCSLGRQGGTTLAPLHHLPGYKPTSPPS